LVFQVHAVKNEKDLKKFIRLPYELYKDDPNWVPPLLVEEKKKYVQTNPSLAHCDYQYFLLFREGKPVGRICVFIHRQAMEHWSNAIGSFGSFECMNDPNGSSILLDTARKWLQDRGMVSMRGPWDFDTKEYGFVVDGFNHSPMLMAPYNPPYYNSQMEAFGMKKVKDLLAYELDLVNGYRLPERFVKLTDRIAEKHHIKIRSIDMKQLAKDVKIILDVANLSTSQNWGYVLVTDAESRAIARSMKTFVDPELVMIAEINGQPVGYVIALPDMNVLIKKLNGRLLPFGFMKLFFGRKNIHQYRIWALGIIPEYQRRAIDTLFYRRLYEILMSKSAQRIEANYVLEDNFAMSNPIRKLGLKEVKRYRAYELSI
jgi:ribosomal protein S18 acetylase RimI-like enzyme